MKKKILISLCVAVLLAGVVAGFLIWRQKIYDNTIKPEIVPAPSWAEEIYFNDEKGEITFYYLPKGPLLFVPKSIGLHDYMVSLDELKSKLNLTWIEVWNTKRSERSQKIAGKYYLSFNSFGPDMMWCFSDELLVTKTYVYCRSYAEKVVPLDIEEGFRIIDEMLSEETKQEILGMAKEAFIEEYRLSEFKYPHERELMKWVNVHWAFPAHYFSLTGERYGHFAENTEEFLSAYYDHLEKEYAKGEDAAS